MCVDGRLQGHNRAPIVEGILDFVGNMQESAAFRSNCCMETTVARCVVELEGFWPLHIQSPKSGDLAETSNAVMPSWVEAAHARSRSWGGGREHGCRCQVMLRDTLDERLGGLAHRYQGWSELSSTTPPRLLAPSSLRTPKLHETTNAQALALPVNCPDSPAWCRVGMPNPKEMAQPCRPAMCACSARVT